MKVIDNRSMLLGEELKVELDGASKLRIMASTFSIFAFEALREELEAIDELEFVFTEPSFATNAVTDKIRKERREFFIPDLAESSLAGSEFEIRLRNRLTQRAIARECAEWVRKKVCFKANASGKTMQPFALVDERSVFQPLTGFTTADLGYERSNAVATMVMQSGDTEVTRTFVDTFEQIWNSPEHVRDVTDAVYDHIASVYAENSPERIYFLILYNIFADFLDDLSEDVLPNDRTGYLETKIWRSLYNFQRDAATGIINKLETYNGCILADSVGLGKTFTALAVIKYYELRNKSVLVLCPKKLAENWTTYNANLKTNLFVEDRFNYDVLAHTDLNRTRGESLGIRLDLVNWGNYDLVVIDESHNFRNADYAEEKESRYQLLMRKVMKEGVKTKVLMLSATPVNNRFNDLKNQLQLAYEGESDDLGDNLNLSTSVERVFADAQTVFNDWSKLPLEERTTDRILAMLDFDFFSLLDAVTIARSRRHIQTFYDTSEIGAFPTRLPPISLREPLTDLKDVPDFEEIYQRLMALTMAVYTPLAYVYPSRLKKYEQYNETAGNARSNIGLAGREQGLKTLMTVNLLKRLESSVEAFRLTLDRVESNISARIAALEAYASRKKGERSSVLGVSRVEFDDDDFDMSLSIGERIRIDLDDMDTLSWGRALRADQEILRQLLGQIRAVTPDHDLKLKRLRNLLQDKVEHPINPGNRKALIFSAFADTANYLYTHLAPELSAAGLESAVITGGSHGAKTTIGSGFDVQQTMSLFSPRSKHRDVTMPGETREVDVLIGTDVISEGQNLQDCDYLVNYDIHWNPVRIIQRFGRIDRIGSLNSVIQLVNFWPDVSLDEYINVKERVENRMVIADIAGTADDNVLTSESADAVFRKEQLRRLQDEVIELEDVKTGVSITDLGLNDFRMDLLGYVKEYSGLKTSPKGLHAVIPADREKGLVSGVIFALRNIKAGDEINRGNRLHPHYLVYLDDDGKVVADHSEAKRLLDLIRSGCRPFETPVQEMVRLFNCHTREGVDMHHYSELLSTAIHSMIGVEEEQDIDSLFTSGPTRVGGQQITGLDDFELTAFVAVLDPQEAE